MTKRNVAFDYENDEKEPEELNVDDADTTYDSDEPSSSDKVVEIICEGIQDFFGGIADFIDDIAIKFF